MQRFGQPTLRLISKRVHLRFVLNCHHVRPRQPGKAAGRPRHRWLSTSLFSLFVSPTSVFLTKRGRLVHILSTHTLHNQPCVSMWTVCASLCVHINHEVDRVGIATSVRRVERALHLAKKVNTSRIRAVVALPPVSPDRRPHMPRESAYAAEIGRRSHTHHATRRGVHARSPTRITYIHVALPTARVV